MWRLRIPQDIAIIATTSFLRDVADDIRAAMDAGLNVICTAEEMSYPWIINPQLAEELDKHARQRHVTVLGAGANPGFIFDALLLTVLRGAWTADSVRVRRVVNCSRFSTTVLRRLGFGYSPEDFAAGVREGRIYGHIGFPQSMHLAAEQLEISIERIDKSQEPLLATTLYSMPHMKVLPGQTAGFVQAATAIAAGKPWFHAEFIGHANPPSAGFEPMDSIEIDGYAPIRYFVKPGWDPQLTSAAVLANSLRRVVESAPGLITVASLPAAVPPRTLKERLFPFRHRTDPKVTEPRVQRKRRASGQRQFLPGPLALNRSLSTHRQMLLQSPSPESPHR